MELIAYVKTLPAKVQKKAAACSDMFELVVVLDEAGYEVPDDITVGSFFTDAVVCPACGSVDVYEVSINKVTGQEVYKCRECGATFEA